MEQKACIDCRHFVDTTDGQLDHLGVIKYEPWCENTKYQEYDMVYGFERPSAKKTRENPNRCGAIASGFEPILKPKNPWGWGWW